MSKMVLIKFSSNWADEMDIEGLYVTTAEKHEAFKQQVVQHFEKSGRTISYYVGSNEEIEYDCANDLLECYEVVCSDIYASGLGALEFANFLPIGFCGPELYDEDEDEDED